jgi:hypothetical protein
MNWKYEAGFKFVDSTGDAEVKILRRRMRDDDTPYYVIEKTYPNGHFVEENINENILTDEIKRGLPFVDPEIESFIQRPRRGRPPEFLGLGEPLFKPKPKAPPPEPKRGRARTGLLTDDQLRRLATCKAKTK